MSCKAQDAGLKKQLSENSIYTEAKTPVNAPNS